MSSSLNHGQANGEGNVQIVCTLCHLTFILPSHLEQHRKLHDASNPHQCAVCSRPFSDGLNLKAHSCSRRALVSQMDATVPTLTGAFSQKTKTPLSQRVDRQERVSTNEKLSCPKYGNVFNRPRARASHERICLRRMPIADPHQSNSQSTQGKAVEENGLLPIHRRRSSPVRRPAPVGRLNGDMSQRTPHLCTRCGKHFRLKVNTRRHCCRPDTKGKQKSDAGQSGLCSPEHVRRVRVTATLDDGEAASRRGVTKKDVITCPDCPRTFTQHRLFVMHSNAHSGPLPHRCWFCRSGFASFAQLQMHIRTIHSGLAASMNGKGPAFLNVEAPSSTGAGKTGSIRQK